VDDLMTLIIIEFNDRYHILVARLSATIKLITRHFIMLCFIYFSTVERRLEKLKCT
jgi:hypothetical protein